MMDVYVLTREVNAYDQFGEYFVAVFANKPTTTQLREHEVPEGRLTHVLKGGGRLDHEAEWFHLRKVRLL